MEPGRLRVALDANVLIAGIRWPRWPHEILRAALRQSFRLVLPGQVIWEARHHLPQPAQLAALQVLLDGTDYEQLPMPSTELVQSNLDLVRSEIDVPIAIALLASSVDIFVTSDRNFTDPDATAARLRERVRILLPAVFLRDELGWSSEELEAIRNRQWSDL